MKKVMDSNRRRMLNAKLREVCDQIGIDEDDIPRLLVTTREVKDLPPEWDIGGRTTCYRWEAFYIRKHKIIFLNLKKIKNVVQAIQLLTEQLIGYRWEYLSWRERQKRYKFIKQGKRYPSEVAQRKQREEYARLHPKEVAERERKKKAEKERREKERQRRYEEWQRQQEEAAERRRRWQEEASGSYPWNLLKIPAGSRIEIIKTAYKKLCLIFHPDRNPPEKKTWAHNQFIQLTSAYEYALTRSS
jgi:hypothetical protein